VIEQVLNHPKTSDRNTPESLYMSKMSKNSVLNSIFELNEKERSIIIMKDVENLTQVHHNCPKNKKNRLKISFSHPLVPLRRSRGLIVFS
jgi:hypothetical protein